MQNLATIAKDVRRAGHHESYGKTREPIGRDRNMREATGSQWKQKLKCKNGASPFLSVRLATGVG